MFTKFKDQNGIAAVELAILLPVLTLILFGIIEFGLLLYNKAVITNASREGARAGVIYQPRATYDDIENIVNNYCKAHLITFASTSPDPEVVTSSTCAKTGDELTVTVTYTYNFLTASLFSSTLDLEGETVMHCE